MFHASNDVEALVRDVFRRISSDGIESVAPSFTINAIYDFPYSGRYVIGNSNLGILFSEVIPKVLPSLRQWPIAIYPLVDDATVLVEYASRGLSAVSQGLYENRYAAVMKLVDDKIDFWREYYNVDWFNKAVGPAFSDLLAKHMPAGSLRNLRDDESNVRRWNSQWVLKEFDSEAAQ